LLILYHRYFKIWNHKLTLPLSRKDEKAISLAFGFTCRSCVEIYLSSIRLRRCGRRSRPDYTPLQV